jgi:hypothetical protein
MHQISYCSVISSSDFSLVDIRKVFLEQSDRFASGKLVVAGEDAKRNPAEAGFLVLTFDLS